MMIDLKAQDPWAPAPNGRISVESSSMVILSPHRRSLDVMPTGNQGPCFSSCSRFPPSPSQPSLRTAVDARLWPQNRLSGRAAISATLTATPLGKANLPQPVGSPSRSRCSPIEALRPFFASYWTPTARRLRSVIEIPSFRGMGLDGSWSGRPLPCGSANTNTASTPSARTLRIRICVPP